ncbi:MAG: hypothetical protein EOP55_24385 [Sphingobacteriales bacterium]|nr:MAG: hypothetical protein EOP55_24385 [Sphingobacteriales bacterium]
MNPGNEDNLDEQQNLNQKALGNTHLPDQPDDIHESTRELKTTGTGSNNAAATPESLIVHDKEEGDDRYESPKP